MTKKKKKTKKYPPVSGGPGVDGQQTISDALHCFLWNLWTVQETNHLLNDICISEDQSDHHTPLQTARLHEHVEQVPEEDGVDSCHTNLAKTGRQ